MDGFQNNLFTQPMTFGAEQVVDLGHPAHHPAIQLPSTTRCLALHPSAQAHSVAPDSSEGQAVLAPGRAFRRRARFRRGWSARRTRRVEAQEQVDVALGEAQLRLQDAVTRAERAEVPK